MHILVHFKNRAAVCSKVVRPPSRQREEEDEEEVRSRLEKIHSRAVAEAAAAMCGSHTRHWSWSRHSINSSSDTTNGLCTQMMALINNTFPLNASLRKKSLSLMLFQSKLLSTYLYTHMKYWKMQGYLGMCTAYVATLFLALVYFSTLKFLGRFSIYRIKSPS